MVSTKSLPWFPPVGHSARRCLPSRGSLGPRFPTFHGTMPRDDCHRAPLGSLRLSLASRYLARSSCSWSPRRARCLVEAPRQRQGLWSPGPPFRVSHKETGGSPTFPSSPCEAMPRSQTPVVSCALAIAHPGLLPSSACKPSAFLSSNPERYPCVHNYTHFGAQSRGLPSRYPRLRTAPYGEARGFAPDLWARRESGRTCTVRFSPPGQPQPIA